MESLEKRIANEFGKPFAFNYQNGHLTHITAPPGVSTMVKNIARGPLDLLALTVKSDLSVYELVEARHLLLVFFIAKWVKCHLKLSLLHLQASIYGTCKSDYIQRKDRNTGVVTLQRTIDLQSCSERAAVTTGLASAVPNALSKMVCFCHTCTHALHSDTVVEKIKSMLFLPVAHSRLEGPLKPACVIITLWMLHNQILSSERLTPRRTSRPLLSILRMAI